MGATLIEAVKTIYRYRELIVSLVSKEMKGRYRGSALGMLWTFLNPLLLLLVYALVFTVYMRIEMENYAVFVFTGLLAWIWFSSSLNEGVNAIVASGDLITKSMFPSLILPMVKVISNFLNYIFSLPLLFIFMAFYGIPFTANLLWLPAIIATQFVFTVGLCYLFSVLNVRFRDTQHILGNFLTLWFFLSPILYPLSQVPQEYHFTFYLNPMAILAMAYHHVFLEGRAPELIYLGAVFVIGMVLTVVGLWVFEKNKETFAENI